MAHSEQKVSTDIEGQDRTRITNWLFCTPLFVIGSNSRTGTPRGRIGSPPGPSGHAESCGRIFKAVQQRQSARKGSTNFHRCAKIHQASRRPEKPRCGPSQSGKAEQRGRKKGVFLGIENRFHFHEIPDFEEIGLILKTFQGAYIRYWHDVGHARVQENLGIIGHNDLLEAYSEKIIGIHLHDVRGLKDHLAPGQGEIDYEEIKPFLKPPLLRSWSLMPTGCKGKTYQKEFGLSEQAACHDPLNPLLSHRPGIFKASKDWNVQLTLACHTHGGQVIVPMVWERGFSI